MHIVHFIYINAWSFQNVNHLQVYVYKKNNLTEYIEENNYGDRLTQIE